MAYGDTPYDEQLKRAWEDFCDKIKSAGSLIFRDTAPPTPLDRATGFQYLSRYISKALNERFEFNEPQYPQLWQLQTPTNKSFGDNPDCTYLVTWLDGKYNYRVVGNRGTVSWVSFICQTMDFASTSAVLNNSQLKTEWDGSFQITLSSEPQPGNWLKIPPGPIYLFIRQFFGEWDTEEPMTIRVERIGAEGAAAPAHAANA